MVLNVFVGLIALLKGALHLATGKMPSFALLFWSTALICITYRFIDQLFSIPYVKLYYKKYNSHCVLVKIILFIVFMCFYLIFI